MNSFLLPSKANKTVGQSKKIIQPTKTIANNRPSAAIQRKLQEMANSKGVLQARPAKNELPEDLRAAIETLSGVSMAGVKVHYNSSKPAEVGALAYAQGSDIYLAPGQEKHLAHEAWHVVQQKQGRVRPTTELTSGVVINDSIALEQEADRMSQLSSAHQISQIVTDGTDLVATTDRVRSAPIPYLGSSQPLIQRVIKKQIGLEYHTAKKRNGTATHNLGWVEYVDINGQKRRYSCASNEEGHTEENLYKYLLGHGFTQDQLKNEPDGVVLPKVTAIYTEREPCTESVLKRRYQREETDRSCHTMLFNRFNSNLPVYYTVPDDPKEFDVMVSGINDDAIINEAEQYVHEGKKPSVEMLEAHRANELDKLSFSIQRVLAKEYKEDAFGGFRDLRAESRAIRYYEKNIDYMANCSDAVTYAKKQFRDIFTQTDINTPLDNTLKLIDSIAQEAAQKWQDATVSDAKKRLHIYEDLLQERVGLSVNTYLDDYLEVEYEYDYSLYHSDNNNALYNLINDFEEECKELAEKYAKRKRELDTDESIIKRLRSRKNDGTDVLSREADLTISRNFLVSFLKLYNERTVLPTDGFNDIYEAFNFLYRKAASIGINGVFSGILLAVDDAHIDDMNLYEAYCLKILRQIGDILSQEGATKRNGFAKDPLIPLAGYTDILVNENIPFGEIEKLVQLAHKYVAFHAEHASWNQAAGEQRASILASITKLTNSWAAKYNVPEMRRDESTVEYTTTSTSGDFKLAVPKIATSMQACLSINPGELVGYEPSGIPLFKIITGSTNLLSGFVQAHLLNKHLGGPGTVENLALLSDVDNTKMSDLAEEYLKREVIENNKVIDYRVEMPLGSTTHASLGTLRPSVANSFATEVRISASVYDSSARRTLSDGRQVDFLDENDLNFQGKLVEGVLRDRNEYVFATTLPDLESISSANPNHKKKNADMKSFVTNQSILSHFEFDDEEAQDVLMREDANDRQRVGSTLEKVEANKNKPIKNKDVTEKKIFLNRNNIRCSEEEKAVVLKMTPSQFKAFKEVVFTTRTVAQAITHARSMKGRPVKETSGSENQKPLRFFFQ